METLIDFALTIFQLRGRTFWKMDMVLMRKAEEDKKYCHFLSFCLVH